MKSNHILITVILVILVGAGAFYGGMRYQKAQQATGQFAAQGGFARGGQGGFYRRFGGQGGAGQNGGLVRGKITSVGNNSITVQMQDGSSKIVLFSNSTNINKAATAATSDLTTGTQVMATGTSNSDGSVTAQFIQINPLMMRRTTTGTPPQAQ